MLQVAQSTTAHEQRLKRCRYPENDINNCRVALSVRERVDRSYPCALKESACKAILFGRAPPPVLEQLRPVVS